MSQPVTLFWFRRDLRIDDNAGLWAALKSGNPVIPLFIFDREILDRLSTRGDARVAFIHRHVALLKEAFRLEGSDLIVRYGTPLDIFRELTTSWNIAEVWSNRDYEPDARMRDEAIFHFLKNQSIPFRAKKDHVIFEKNEVMKDDGKPYTVFTPYSRKWKTLLTGFHLKPYPTRNYVSALHRFADREMPALEEINFRDPGIAFPENLISENVLKNYADQRDIPSVQGTTRISVHLRFGTVSIRQLASLGSKLSPKWLDELIWRDFYQMILYHFPQSVDHAFKLAYNRIPWRNSPEDFEAWCEGRTGYPLVDAGMRELNTTGFMHNRVRMVVASFLTKHLLIDWRLGERYFAEKLLDFELASNVGGWQWAAGSGCDAAPYFRVFNPTSQQEKFDPEKKYICKWIPEFGTPSYPPPIVDHAFARERCLNEFRSALREPEP